MAAKHELKQGRTGKCSFVLKATNGQVILSSESYPDRKSASKGLQSVQRNAANPKRYEIRAAKNGEQYFVLKAGNGEIIGMSERYQTARSLNAGIASVQKNGPAAAVVDLTAPPAKAAKVSPAKKAAPATKATKAPSKPKRAAQATAPAAGTPASEALASAAPAADPLASEA